MINSVLESEKDSHIAGKYRRSILRFIISVQMFGNYASSSNTVDITSTLACFATSYAVSGYYERLTYTRVY